MHDCPDCNQACTCDGEDHWNDAASEECTHDCDESEEIDRDDDRSFQWGGSCVVTQGCINCCNHFAPDECETEAIARAWARRVAKEMRNQRRRGMRDPWRAAIRRALRIERRYGGISTGSDIHRLTRRAWERAEAIHRRSRKRRAPYYPKRIPADDLPW